MDLREEIEEKEAEESREEYNRRSVVFHDLLMKKRMSMLMISDDDDYERSEELKIVVLGGQFKPFSNILQALQKVSKLKYGGRGALNLTCNAAVINGATLVGVAVDFILQLSEQTNIHEDQHYMLAITFLC